MGMTRKTVVGHWQAPRVQERIGMWARAACGWQEAGRLQVARFGDNMRGVAVTEGDKVGAQIQLGTSVNGYGADALGLAVADASPSVVEGLLADYERDYELAPELRTGVELVHGGLRLPPWPGGAENPGAHMLEVCPSIAGGRPSCEIHPLSIVGREDPVRLVFTAPAGPAMLVCLVDVGGRLRLIANQVDVLASSGAGTRPTIASLRACNLSV